jgi:hypothetical protein
MHKYAAATALVITLIITMLTPAVSASGGTPQCPIITGGGCGPGCYVGYLGTGLNRERLKLRGFCIRNCRTELWYTAKLWDSTQNCVEQPLLKACIAKCEAAKTAAQH